ncbi:hypothetical protein [Clostridium novyi]|uniref:Lipoprotein, putative n=1 Tax=Clostridium novyi (strain NT) TaxID=386415 RepID=A0Q3J9_CLONN|nr:hypothetical protein [Clostridium novyi]ABK62621.1 lipoprotein, putative [Clostridium novyi NT]KEH86595.1 hypothetical protein Z966_02455 [Clostridium novyi A str. NCTC 538]
MNKKFLVSILMIATIFSCIGLTGCKKTKTTNAPTKQEQVKKQDKEQKQVNKEDSSKKINESKKFETKNETACYRVFGEKNEKKVYYTMDMPEAKAISKFIFNYLKIGENVDYKTVKGDPQFEMYSKNLQKKYGGKEHANQVIIDACKKIEIVEHFAGIENYNYLQFNKDFTTCKVSVNRLSEYSHFSKDCELAKAGVQYNKIYSKEITYNLILENGKWKIDDEIASTTLYPYEPELSK